MPTQTTTTHHTIHKSNIQPTTTPQYSPQKHLTRPIHTCYNRNQALIRRPPEKRQRIAASGGRNLRCSCRRLK